MHIRSNIRVKNIIKLNRSVIILINVILTNNVVEFSVELQHRKNNLKSER